MKRILLLTATLFFIFLVPHNSLSAQTSERLALYEGDVAIFYNEAEEGLHLWVRKKPGIESILIADSVADPNKKNPVYTFRTYDYNPINGDERRILDGKFIEPGPNHYYLLDSSPEYSDIFKGEAFHIFIPFFLTYGYPWTREGQIEVRQGTWLNLRTFNAKYANYDQGFKDNPFILNMKELPPAVEEDMEELKRIEIFTEVARRGNGELKTLTNHSEIPPTIEQILQEQYPGDLDVVIVLDTTISMKDELLTLRSHLVETLRPFFSDSLYKVRVGFVFYRDYNELYLTRRANFTDNIRELEVNLSRAQTQGGGDIPEAVYEGIYEGLISFDWRADKRVIIQIGDAIPHEVPKGKITDNTVFYELARSRVRLYPVLLSP